ncbi:hypothetical protein AMTRI_Chr02g214170 [Amborella trichopoda]
MVYKIHRLHCIEPSLVIFSPLLLIIQSSVSNSFHHHLLSFLLSSLYSKFSLSKPFTQNMMHSKRIMETARKWKKHAMRQRVRISLKATTSEKVGLVADEGHFIIYTTDRSHFVIPLAYLNQPIFGELLFMAEEEFGGRIKNRACTK